MNELAQIIQLIEGVREDMRDGFRKSEGRDAEQKRTLERVEAEGRRTNGRVTKLEEKAQSESETRRFRRNWKYDLAAGTALLALNFLLTAIFVTH